eukprot:TRINITY_DN5664_c0_g3_i4.p1 TRINITY_DN5664_c0_g3~~TRINITY_DN5664_c0_g3_i4.p1  ORF type:complete len:355 (-),score=55.07 TRINITY_DN5664_c0_g3_i4:656-1720(-)
MGEFSSNSNIEVKVNRHYMGASGCEQVSDMMNSLQHVSQWALIDRGSRENFHPVWNLMEKMGLCQQAELSKKAWSKIGKPPVVQIQNSEIVTSLCETFSILQGWPDLSSMETREWDIYLRPPRARIMTKVQSIISRLMVKILSDEREFSDYKKWKKVPGSFVTLKFCEELKNVSSLKSKICYYVSEFLASIVPSRIPDCLIESCIPNTLYESCIPYTLYNRMIPGEPYANEILLAVTLGVHFFVSDFVSCTKEGDDVVNFYIPNPAWYAVISDLVYPEVYTPVNPVLMEKYNTLFSGISYLLYGLPLSGKTQANLFFTRYKKHMSLLQWLPRKVSYNFHLNRKCVINQLPHLDQ